ncbi:MAG: ABC transporter substrate-binding protein [Acidimicrobiales bacterium]|nr:ABC transporter substrate-binding protein [Acidimicrobiales bacterium]
MTGERRRLRGAEQRPLRGYAPLVVLVAAIAVMVAVVPSKVPDDRVAADAAGPAEVTDGQPASGWGDTVAPCEDRDLQVDDLEYSPPCFEFTGDNGGATARGVTDDEILVSFRLPADTNLFALLGQLGGVDIDADSVRLAEDAEAIVEYFNENFEFYGRKLRLVGYDGRGQIIPELQGAGQDAATNDSLRVANEIGAFADLSALSQPYADALTRNEVIAMGAPYLSREWFEERRPYAWSTFPDCTAVAENSAPYTNRRLLGRDATHAGGDLAGQPRTMAVVSPNNLEYQQCVDVFVDGLAAEGNDVAERLDYSIDITTLQTSAASIVAKLKAADVTSVSCACDAIMQMYLAKEAAAQGYEPEWLIAGVGFIETDLGGQIVANNAPEQWARSFGGSPWAAQQPPERSVAHAAYRSVRPDGDPTDLLDLVYHQVLVVALGVQMAGPDLTPETFEAGLFAYPPGEGQAGAWDFSPGHYTPVTDIREMWWDPDALSPFNGKPGTYLDEGERWQKDDIPEGEPEVLP